MERRVTAPRVAQEEETVAASRREGGREGTRGLYDRCPEIKGFRPPSEIKLTNRGNESLVRPLLASAALPERRAGGCYVRVATTRCPIFSPCPLVFRRGVVAGMPIPIRRKSDVGR